MKYIELKKVSVYIFSFLLLFLFNTIKLFACEKAFLPGTIEFSLRVQNGAIASLDHNIQLNPTQSVGYYSRGEAKIGLIDYQLAIAGDIQIAVKSLMKFSVYDKDGKTYYMRKGGTSPFSPNNTENYEKAVRSAIDDFDQAIELHPHYYQAYRSRGSARYRLQEYDSAIKDLDRAIAIGYFYSYAYMERGIIKFLFRDDKVMYDEAMSDLSKAIELNPNFAPYYYERGLANLEANKPNEAIEDFNRAIRVNPYFALAYYSRGNAYMELGKTHKTIMDYEKANKLNPNLPESPSFTEYLDFN